MLKQYNVIEFDLILRQTQPPPPIPPAADRAAWQAARDRLGKEQVEWFIEQAEKAAAEEIPFLRASLYLQCKRTGDRPGYENPSYRRRTMLRDLLLGECLEYQGRFLDSIMDVIWAICEESSWAYPAHQFELADMPNPTIDLGVAGTAFELAEACALIEPELDPRVGQRIRHEINWRCFEPYLTRHNHWWLHTSSLREVNNWTAVCNAGVMAAAIYLEQDSSRLAEILARGASSLDDYLDTFDEDGGSSEGPGYWTYGFGYYTLIAHLVEHRTQGRVRFLDGDRLRKICQFPLNAIMSSGMWVNFSDAPRHATFIAAQMAYLAHRVDLPGLYELAKTQPPFTARPEMAWLLRSLFWDIPGPGKSEWAPAKHDWYNGMMWMFSRYQPENPNTLVLAAKGGHNAEMHNQNDVGSFIVHVNQESIIADVGCGRYTRQYFGPERYDHFVCSSLGHSVPLPNGKMQEPGRQYASQLLEHSNSSEWDVLHLQLKDTYPPEAGLASLERRIVFHRDEPDGWVELEDTYAFKDGPASFESALTTFARVEIGENAVVLQGQTGKLRIGFDPQALTVRADLFSQVDLSDGLMDVYRVVFSPRENQAAGAIRLEIFPIT